MSEPTPKDPKVKSDNVTPDPKDKGKGLDKFITPGGTPIHKGDNKIEVIVPVIDPKTEDVNYKEELEKLQKKQYNTERKIVLGELETLNPEVAEKYKSKKLSDLETALEVAKINSPKFPVNREAPVEPAAPRGGFLNRRTGKWE